MKEEDKYESAMKTNQDLAGRTDEYVLELVDEAMPILWKAQIGGMKKADLLIKVADEIMKKYSADNYQGLNELENVPEKVKTFVEKVDKFRGY